MKRAASKQFFLDLQHVALADHVRTKKAILQPITKEALENFLFFAKPQQKLRIAIPALNRTGNESLPF
jgi:hypothetical protein